MNRLVIFLNERSCQVDIPVTRDQMLGCILSTLEAMRAVRKLRSDVLLACQAPITRVSLGDGTYSLASILTGDAYKEEWRFIANLNQSSPWEAYPGAGRPGDLEGVSYKGTMAIGMTWAKRNESAVLSFGHPPDWNRHFIEARFDKLDDGGDLHSTSVEIRNISAPAHAESHRESLKGCGSAVSPSSLIHEGNGFVIRMYSYDHNPPHFHVLLRSDTSESQAKVEVATLDTLAGHLPPAIRRTVKEWAKNHRQELSRNWERCRTGERPILLG